MTTITRRSLLAAAAILTAFAPSGAVLAQAWPSKTITIIVPFPPGGTTDITGRQLAAELQKSLGVTVVVENKPGANGNIGSAQVARAAPDGYTLLMSGVGSNAVNHGLYSNMPYDSRTDFAHVTQLTSGPNVLVVNTEFPARTLPELIALAKANPGKFNFASSGNGASGHMAMELLKLKAGIKMEHIPYKGGAPGLTDVIGGVVPMMFINQDMPPPHIKTGKLRVLGVASLEPNPLYPGVPTIAEQGFPGFAAVSWNGLSAPKGTPSAIVDRLQQEAKKAFAQPELREKLEKSGFVVVTGTPAEYTAFIDAEITKWTEVAKTAGAKVD